MGRDSSGGHDGPPYSHTRCGGLGGGPARERVPPKERGITGHCDTLRSRLGRAAGPLDELGGWLFPACSQRMSHPQADAAPAVAPPSSPKSPVHVYRSAVVLAPRDPVIPPTGTLGHRVRQPDAEFKLEGRHTGNALCLGIAHTPPGAGPPPHVHHRDDEVFVVLEGEFELPDRDRMGVGPPGHSGVRAAGSAAHLPQPGLDSEPPSGPDPSRRFRRVLPALCRAVRGRRPAPPPTAAGHRRRVRLRVPGPRSACGRRERARPRARPDPGPGVESCGFTWYRPPSCRRGPSTRSSRCATARTGKICGRPSGRSPSGPSPGHGGRLRSQYALWITVGWRPAGVPRFARRTSRPSPPIPAAGSGLRVRRDADVGERGLRLRARRPESIGPSAGPLRPPGLAAVDRAAVHPRVVWPDRDTGRGDHDPSAAGIAAAESSDPLSAEWRPGELW